MSRQASLWMVLAACAVATLTSWTGDSWAPRLSVTLLLSAGSFWLLARRDSRIETTDRAVWLLLAIPVWGAMQLLLGLSVYANASLLAIAYWASLALIFYVATQSFAEKQHRNRMLAAFAILASVLAWVALLQPYAGSLGIESMRSVAADAYVGSFANRNTYACFAELALPVLLWLGLRPGRVRWFWCLSAAALMGSVVNSGSRAGALLILAECIVFAFLVSRGHKLHWKLAFGAAVVLIAVGVATLGDGTLAVRLQYGDPFVFRREIYQSGIAMFAERPLTGFGLGTFSAAYPAYALFDNGRFVNLAHNDWLQLSVEGGLAALGLFAYFTVLLLGGLRHSIWAIGIPVVLLHALVDFPLHRTGVAAWWMLLAGALRCTTTSRASVPRARSTSRRQPRTLDPTPPLPPAESTPVPLSAQLSDRS